MTNVIATFKKNTATVKYMILKTYFSNLCCISISVMSEKLHKSIKVAPLFIEPSVKSDGLMVLRNYSMSTGFVI